MRGAGVAPSTRRGYVTDVRRLLTWAERRGQSSRSVRATDLAAYRDELSEGRTAASVRRALSALRRYFAYLLDAGIRGDVPTATVRGPRVLRWSTVVPSRRALEDSLLKAAGRGHALERARNRMVLLVLLRTGLRLHELVALRWPDVDLDGGTLRVRGGRARRSRVVPMALPVRRALSAWRTICLRHARDPRGPVLSRDGRPMAARTIQRHLQLLGAEAGLGSHLAHPRAFRRAFAASYLEDHDADLQGLKEALGHASMTSTALYVGIGRSEVR